MCIAQSIKVSTEKLLQVFNSSQVCLLYLWKSPKTGRGISQYSLVGMVVLVKKLDLMVWMSFPTLVIL